MENQINVGGQNTQQISQNPASQPLQIPEKPKVNYLVVGATILIGFVLFGFGGYYLGKQASKNMGLNQNQTIPLPTNTANDPSANWKTYTDTKAGFSLKYPSDYFIFQGDSSLDLSGFFVATSQPQGGVGPKFLPNLTDVWLGAYGSKNINFQTVDQYLTSQQDSFNNATKIPMTIGGMSGYKVVSTVQSYCAGNSCTTIYVYDGLVLKNNSIYVISMSSLDQKALYANETMFDQILSTFKFVDNTLPSGVTSTDYDQAVSLLTAIPEIQIIQNSVIKAGRKPFFTPEGESGNIVTVSLRESFPDDPHTSRIDTFNVNVKSKVITVEDFVTNKQLSLDEWKKTVKERFQ